MNHAVPRFVLHCLTLFCLCFALAAPFAAQAAQDIGQVMSLVPGASVLRSGKAEDLAPRSGIRVSDVVRTDASGRPKILFDDDSSVSLGPNTVMDMSEYADAGSASAFGVHLTHGLARVITGKIVDQNPGGFKMTAPLATVGIRGTIVSMRVEENRTTLYAENTLREVLINGVNVPSGSKAVLQDGVMRQEPITPQDRRELGQALALRGGTGTAAAAPEPMDRGGLLAGTGFLFPGNGLPGIPLVTQNIGDNLASPAPAPGPAPGPLMGLVSGTLIPASPNYLSSGSFNFAVNLTSGAISGGNINIAQTNDFFDATYWSAQLSGGTGLANAAGFTMSASGAYYDASGVSPGGPASATISGAADLLPAPDNSSFSVDYGLDFTDSGGVIRHDGGSGTGTITK